PECGGDNESAGDQPGPASNTNSGRSALATGRRFVIHAGGCPIRHASDFVWRSEPRALSCTSLFPKIGSAETSRHRRIKPSPGIVPNNQVDPKRESGSRFPGPSFLTPLGCFGYVPRQKVCPTG